MDVSKKLTIDVDLQQVVSEIKADAVKGSFWNTVTIEPNKTSVTE